MIADDPVTFAGSVVQLLQDRKQGAMLAEQAHRTLMANYEADSVREKLLSLV
ncbi:hypothetical protein D3C75_1292620 [compost metagenome]